MKIPPRRKCSPSEFLSISGWPFGIQQEVCMLGTSEKTGHLNINIQMSILKPQSFEFVYSA